jgi:hypothetical protein
VPVEIVVIQEARLLGAPSAGGEPDREPRRGCGIDRRPPSASTRKTDAIDGETLLRTLWAWKRGEPRVCAMVAPPSPEQEDQRRLSRERAILMRELFVELRFGGCLRRLPGDFHTIPH